MADRTLAAQGFLVDAQNDVAGLDAGLLGALAGLDEFDEDGSVVDLLGLRVGAGEVVHADAEVAARDFALGEELLADFADGVGGMAKPMPWLTPVSLAIMVLMPTTWPAMIEERPAAVAGVDGGVGLQQFDEVERVHESALGADDAVRSAENARRSIRTSSRLQIALVMSAGWQLAVAAARADEPGETIVVVDPAPVVRASEDEAASASVITTERTPRSAEQMADLLDGVPGVTVSRLGGVGAPALLSLRGSIWEQVSVYLDGVNLNLATGGGVDLATLPVGDVERVEIYRGATPIAYGGSAIGGVVAVETRSPTATGATLEAGGGSFGTSYGGGSLSLANAVAASTSACTRCAAPATSGSSTTRARRSTRATTRPWHARTTGCASSTAWRAAR